MEFLLFPDSAAAAALAETIRSQVPVQMITHASGRPWVVGRWSDGQLVSSAVGQRRIAILGCAATTCETLAEALGRARDVADLDGLARVLPGSFHLAASMGGRVRAQGSISTARQVFHARIAGITIAADRPQTLAALTGASVAEELLSPRLLSPCAPWPLGEQCLWRGVDSLPAGCYLALEPDGSARAVRWWAPPEPALPLSEGAGLVRAALHDAVAARTSRGGTISADLSGGMDSTSLCFLAASGPARLLTTRWEATDPADDDATWAQTAGAALPDAERLVLSRKDAPLCFTDLLAPQPEVEAPFLWIRTRSQLAYQARLVAGRGSVTHLTGHGGDELFFATPLHLHQLVRAAPWRSVRSVRAYRALYRWRLGATLRGLADSRSFAGWLAACADTFTEPMRQFSGTPDFGWWIGFRMPAWATADAVDATRRILREAAAREPEPLAPLRAQHAALQDVRQCGDAIRRVSRLTSEHGVPWEAPYIDDRVVEAALAIRYEDAAALDRYKPALAAAMRGVVPDAVLGRSTKSEYSAEVYAGLRHHRPELLALCDDMRLARLGLVNAGAFRDALLGLHPSSLTMIPLIGTLACETWLRSLTPHTTLTTTSVGGPR